MTLGERTTPEPVYVQPNPAPPTTAPRLDAHEKLRLRGAAYRATKLYPGPVGKLIEREILAADEMSCRFVNGSLIAELVDEMMRPRPQD